MNQFKNVYKVERDNDAFPAVLRYHFVSRGKHLIAKTVEYQYLSDVDGYSIFNLAFGNHNLEDNSISDGDICNNGDHYKVLHTVLNTIPMLFETYENVILVIRGSDSSANFQNQCRLQCSRNCNKGPCKMAHRRINIYRSFLERNFEQLNQKYLFWGRNDNNMQLVEPYKKGGKYDAVYVMKKS